MDSSIPNSDSNSNPLRDPRLSFLLAVQHPSTASTSAPSSPVPGLSNHALHDPALQSAVSPSSAPHSPMLGRSISSSMPSSAHIFHSNAQDKPVSSLTISKPHPNLNQTDIDLSLQSGPVQIQIDPPQNVSQNLGLATLDQPVSSTQPTIQVLPIVDQDRSYPGPEHQSNNVHTKSLSEPVDPAALSEALNQAAPAQVVNQATPSEIVQQVSLSDADNKPVISQLVSLSTTIQAPEPATGQPLPGVPLEGQQTHSIGLEPPQQPQLIGLGNFQQPELRISNDIQVCPSVVSNQTQQTELGPRSLENQPKTNQAEPESSINIEPRMEHTESSPMIEDPPQAGHTAQSSAILQDQNPLPAPSSSMDLMTASADLTSLQAQLSAPNGHAVPVPGNFPDSGAPANGDQEMARSREMSLSLDSNPDAPVQPAAGQANAPGPAELLQNDPNASLVKPIAQLSMTPPAPFMFGLNSESPQTATALKFPLPAKPSIEHNTPLFAPSPPGSVAQEHHRSPPRQPVLSRLASLRQRVEKDGMDGEAWIELIADAEKKGDLEKTREVYQSFLQNFPDAATQWIAYANLELGHGHFAEVEQIFSRCLRSSVSVELWAFYLNYIRRVNPVEGEKAAVSRATIISAYDFSLNHIGIDHESGQIWLDYINIVKAGEATGTWQEQQKMDSLRKLYQRAVCIPLDNLEQLWKEYDFFEHQMSKMTAKKFLADKSAQYMMARSALKEMKALTDPLLRPKVPVKPNWKRVDDHKQLAQWKAYLAWEEKNPLEISDENVLNSRIQYAYRQAVMHMRFHPEIWYLAASHLQKNDKPGEALAVLQAGLTANHTSIVLTYALVEALENQKNYASCYAAFESLVQYYHSEIDEINKTIEKEIAHGIPIIESKTTGAMGEGEGEQELTEEEKQRAKEEEQLRFNTTALYKPKIDELREAAASVWITEMRFARRTEGIKPARAVFSRARKSAYITRHVFEASAMIEYYWNKEANVATKVFDLGLKSFSEDVDYVLQYLNFLITLNDDSNARALFEKTVSKIPPEAARPLWRRWAAYEFIYGDKTASEKLNVRMAEHFPDWGVVERLSERHNYGGLGDVLGRELGSAVEPIPLRRSPSPVPAHLEGFGFKRAPANASAHPGPIPSGPAQYRSRQRERSFSPDIRGKRARAPRGSVSPDRRNGGPVEIHGVGPNKRGRENHEGAKRNRFSSPPPRVIRDASPGVGPPQPSVMRENPYAWFPECLRYFLSMLPTANSFEGPRLDTHTVLQVLAESNIPTINAPLHHNPNHNHSNNTHSSVGGGHMSHNNGGHSNRGGRGEGFHNNAPPGWGPNRGGGGGNLHQTAAVGRGGGGGGSNRRGRRK